MTLSSQLPNTWSLLNAGELATLPTFTEAVLRDLVPSARHAVIPQVVAKLTAATAKQSTTWVLDAIGHLTWAESARASAMTLRHTVAPHPFALPYPFCALTIDASDENPALQQATLEALHQAWCAAEGGDDPVIIRELRRNGVLFVVVRGGSGHTPDLYAVAARASEGDGRPDEAALGVVRVLLDRALRDVAEGRISRTDALTRALDPLARMVSSTRAALTERTDAWRDAFGTFDRSRAYDAFRTKLRETLEQAMRLIERTADRTARDDAALGHLREAASLLAFRVFFVTAIEGRRLLYAPGFTPRYHFRGLVEAGAAAPESCFLLLQDLTAAIRESKPVTGRSLTLRLAVHGASIFGNRPTEHFAPDVEAWLDGLDAGTRALAKDRARLAAWDEVVANLAILATGQIRHYEAAAGRNESDVSVGGAAHAQRVLGDVYEQILAMTPVIEGSGSARMLRLVPPGAKVAKGDAAKGEAARTKAERRALGAHYTPESLVLEVVRAALEPAFAAAWSRAEAKPASYVEEILGLRVLDPAMGSAHFLTVAALEIAREVAWAERYAKPRPAAHFEFITDANPWLALPAEDRAALDVRAAAALADVAQRCCFGVDIAPLAVELGKLALWQLTMVERKARGLADDAPPPSLTFLDANLRCGDSLLGATWGEVVTLCRDFDLEGADGSLFGDKSASVKGAVELIQALEPLLAGGAAALRKELTRSRKQITKELGIDFAELPDDEHGLRQRAFELVQEGKARFRWLWDLALLRAWYAAGHGREGDAAMRASLKVGSSRSWAAIVGTTTPTEAQERARAAIRAEALRLRAFHWELEFYEVFHRPAAGFDLIVANPPFVGSQRIRAAAGETYTAFLKASVGGVIDICGFFLRRFASLLSPVRGVVGTVATNTIAQGDNRTLGLRPLLKESELVRGVPFEIFRSCQSRVWPGDAAVHIATVHLRRTKQQVLTAETRRIVQVFDDEGDAENETEPDNSTQAGSEVRLMVVPLDDAVDCSFLDGGVEVELNKIAAQDELAFQGMIPRGPFDRPLSFLEVVPKSERSAVYAYLNNRDVQQQPEPAARRVIIDVYDALSRAKLLQAEAREQERWLKSELPTVYRELKQTAFPYRQALPLSKDNDGLREYWWLFEKPRPALRRAWDGIERVVLIGRVGKALSVNAVSRIDPSLGIGLCPTLDSFVVPAVALALNGVLDSKLFETQVRRSCSSHETRLRFTPSEVFPFFSFPWSGKATTNEAVAPVLSPPKVVEDRLGSVAKTLLTLRRELLIDPARHGIAAGEFRGPTALYNAFDNPEDKRPGIEALRAAHRTLEAAVLAEYGWQDLATPNRWTFDRPWIDGTWRYVPNLATRREYLTRLAALNKKRTTEPTNKQTTKARAGAK